MTRSHGYRATTRTTERERSLSKLVGLFIALALIASACSSDAVDQTAPVDEADQVEPEIVEDEELTTATSPSTPEITTTTGAPATTTTRPDFAGSAITVGVRENPTMDLIREITDEFFTLPTGIEVQFVDIPPEMTFRDFETGIVRGPSFDALMIDPFETPQVGANGWVHDLAPFAIEDEGYDLAGFIPSTIEANSTNDGLFAVPFYAESTMIMYNQQIIDDAGIDFPEAPTWQQVADIARQLDTDETTGICLNGIAEWDQLGAALTTVVNTFGGTWWEANEDGTPGEAQIDQPDSGFRAATELYLNLATDAGPDNFTQTGFDQCNEQFQNGEVAIWYGTTAAPPSLESEGSVMAGNVGYARAPIDQTAASGALWTWGLTLPIGGGRPDAGWEFIRWATSPDTIQVMAEQAPGGWTDPAVVGAATRNSHFDIPAFAEATEPYIDIVFDELNAADPNNPGTTPRPGLPGVQYVGIPEFQQVATDCSTELSAAVNGSIAVDEALNTCQDIASEVTQ